MKEAFFAVLFFIFFALLPQNAFSCSCGHPTQLNAFRSSKVVIIGKFVKIAKDGIEFKVVKSWKGAKKDEIISLYYFDIAGCDVDIDLVEGKEYLLYAEPFRDEQKPMVWVDCGRSAEVKDAKEDIENMDKVVTESKKQSFLLNAPLPNSTYMRDEQLSSYRIAWFSFTRMKWFTTLSPLL